MMKHPCNADFATELVSSPKVNTDEHPSAFYELGEAKQWVFYPRIKEC